MPGTTEGSHFGGRPETILTIRLTVVFTRVGRGPCIQILDLQPGHVMYIAYSAQRPLINANSDVSRRARGLKASRM